MDTESKTGRAKREDRKILKIFRILLDAYGQQGWWPLTVKKGSEPEYCGGHRSRLQRFEVAVGAVLTQNTSWKNASRAVMNLSAAGLLDPSALASAPASEIARLIRPSGYFNQKAERLAVLARYFLRHDIPDRDSLLSLKGIGPETADSIMLYGFGRPFFVIDAYTRRLFGRLGILSGGESYDEARILFEQACGKDPALMGEYHALIVEQGKRYCRVSPECRECPLAGLCRDRDCY